jgi:arylsulfatase A-like enzyme
VKVNVTMKSIPILVLLLVATSVSHAAEAKPNIVLILADDLGYADVGAYGCKDVPTPHIDSIAKHGVRFTDGYATNMVCSSSRAGLISGMYQQRFGFEHNSGPERYASPKFGVPRNIPTLAEKLKQAGYATGMVGKWHIGFREGLRPNDRGFDFFYGFLSGARSYYPDAAANSPLSRNGQRDEDEPKYLTDAFARESVAFIQQHKDEPFFLYLAFNAVHTPMQATKKYLDRFPAIRNRKRQALAGMLSAMDDAIGRVMETLSRLDLEENTLVLFYSDNGGIPPKNASRNDPLRGQKGQVFEGGIRIPFLIQWKGKLPAGITYEQPVMGFDCHATALAAAGIAVPENKPIDGVDLIPYVTGKQKGRPHEQLFWRAGKKHAARVGDWKLVVTPRFAPMLFNLEDDIGEQTNLAKRRPKKLKELQTAYNTWDAQMMAPRWIRQDRRNAKPGGKLKNRS